MSISELASPYEALHILHPATKDYAWGSRTLLPTLAGTLSTGKPEAEMWFGTHPTAPTFLQSGGTLEELVKLPYLVKLLAAARPLSIQAHPDIEQARTGFDAENADGIPLDHPRRTFRDANHKPEMLVALSEFTALVGFCEPQNSSALFGTLARIVNDVRVAKTLTLMARQLAEGQLKHVFNQLVDPDGPFGQPNGWTRSIFDAISASDTKDKNLLNALAVAQHYPDDPGAIVTLLMNLVELSPGEAFFVPSRIIHAYCSGLALEVMATSDNVIRSGLTAKHINIAALDEVLEYKAGPVPYLEPIISQRNNVTIKKFDPPTREFVVTQYNLPASSHLSLSLDKPHVAVCVKGTGSFTSASSAVDISPAKGIYLSGHTQPVELSSNSTGLTVFTVTQP